MAVLLGALLADVPHSRPVSVTAHATDPGLIQRLALQPPTYEGPTGIVGVLHQALRGRRPARRLAVGGGAALRRGRAEPEGRAGAAAAARSPWSASPSTPPTSRTRRPTTSSRCRRAVELDPDVQAFVERLERAADEESGRPDPGSLPSGDVLAREFQRFLRQRGDDAR